MATFRPHPPNRPSTSGKDIFSRMLHMENVSKQRRLYGEASPTNPPSQQGNPFDNTPPPNAKVNQTLAQGKTALNADPPPNRSQTTPDLAGDARGRQLSKVPSKDINNPPHQPHTPVEHAPPEICRSPSWSDYGEKGKAKKKEEREMKEAEKKKRAEDKSKATAVKTTEKVKNATIKKDKRTSKPPAAMETQRMPFALRRPSFGSRSTSTAPSPDSPNFSKEARRSSISSLASLMGFSRSSSRSNSLAPSPVEGTFTVNHVTRQPGGVSGVDIHSQHNSRPTSAAHLYDEDLIKFAYQLQASNNQPHKVDIQPLREVYDTNYSPPVKSSKVDRNKAEMTNSQNCGLKPSNVSRAKASAPTTKHSEVTASRNAAKSQPPKVTDSTTTNAEGRMIDNDPKANDLARLRERESLPGPMTDKSRERTTPASHSAAPVLNPSSYVQKQRMYLAQRSIARFEEELSIKRANDPAIHQEADVGLGIQTSAQPANKADVNAAELRKKVSIQRPQAPPTPRDSKESLDRAMPQRDAVASILTKKDPVQKDAKKPENSRVENVQRENARKDSGEREMQNARPKRDFQSEEVPLRNPARQEKLRNGHLSAVRLQKDVMTWETSSEGSSQSSAVFEDVKDRECRPKDRIMSREVMEQEAHRIEVQSRKFAERKDRLQDIQHQIVLAKVPIQAQTSPPPAVVASSSRGMSSKTEASRPAVKAANTNSKAEGAVEDGESTDDTATFYHTFMNGPRPGKARRRGSSDLRKAEKFFGASQEPVQSVSQASPTPEPRSIALESRASPVKLTLPSSTKQSPRPEKTGTATTVKSRTSFKTPFWRSRNSAQDKAMGGESKEAMHKSRTNSVTASPIVVESGPRKDLPRASTLPILPLIPLNNIDLYTPPVSSGTDTSTASATESRKPSKEQPHVKFVGPPTPVSAKTVPELASPPQPADQQNSPLESPSELKRSISLKRHKSDPEILNSLTPPPDLPIDPLLSFIPDRHQPLTKPKRNPAVRSVSFAASPLLTEFDANTSYGGPSFPMSSKIPPSSLSNAVPSRSSLKSFSTNFALLPPRPPFAGGTGGGEPPLLSPSKRLSMPVPILTPSSIARNAPIVRGSTIFTPVTPSPIFGGPSSHSHSADALALPNVQAKPTAKMFVICCKCRYWHDLPSRLYEAMAIPKRIDYPRSIGANTPRRRGVEEWGRLAKQSREKTSGETSRGSVGSRESAEGVKGVGEKEDGEKGKEGVVEAKGKEKEEGEGESLGKEQGKVYTTVKCPWCEHPMSTACCEGWTAVVKLYERHH